MSTNRPRKKVMISSTSLDLPEHRQQVIDACLRMDCEPLPMEILGARDANAVQESLRLVDEADIYIGIFAHRYGFIPPEQEKSITELEYDRAVEREIPRLIFFMHDEHPITVKEVETGPGAEKLKKLKERIGVARVAAFFKSKDGLRADVVQALSQLRESTGQEIQFHYVSDIPVPPEEYIAHPYVLLQSRQLIGRREELNLLTDWVAKPGSPPYHSRLFHLVAIGGQGKSALTWHWFQNVAEQEMKPLAGRMWWSFYESDASFENFIIRALAYVARKKIEEVRQIEVADRERMLLTALDRDPYLIVFDGLERLLLAYSGHNVGRLQDDTLDADTANYVAAAHGLPASAAQSFIGQHRLRLTADRRVGAFLKKLTFVRASRILVSTRLYPADLQTPQGAPASSCFACFLPGLSDDDALSLWREFGAKGSRETMLPMLKSFDKHPLLVQALASVVSNARRAAGDFDLWRHQNPEFNPLQLLDSADRKSHVLSCALRGLDERQLQLLQTVAGFRMPTTYETLAALFVQREPVTYSSEPELDAALVELEDRGLLGWDRRSNRYDLHPIVRGVVWDGANAIRRREVFASMHDHFAPIQTKEWTDVESLDDLTAAIELFHALIALERYDEAFVVFRDRLDVASQFRLSAQRMRIELLERLFPNGFDKLPRLSDIRSQSYALTALGIALRFSGKPRDAISALNRAREIDETASDQVNTTVDFVNLSEVQRQVGDLQSAETLARKAVLIAQKRGTLHHVGISLYTLGRALAVRIASPLPTTHYEQAIAPLQRAFRLFRDAELSQSSGLGGAFLAEAALYHSDYDTARSYADFAWNSADRVEADFIRAAHLQGVIELRANTRGHRAEESISFAHERLNNALTRLHTCQLVEEELATLIGLAELHCVLASGTDSPFNLSPAEHLHEARQMLDDVWQRAEDGPYPTFHADAFNMLARIERASAALAFVGSSEADLALSAAKTAALAAYEKAWCQGPPFAYAFGLYHAKKHLTELGVRFPDMPPFDESQYEPMPEVEIDPPEPVQ